MCTSCRLVWKVSHCQMGIYFLALCFPSNNLLLAPAFNCQEDDKKWVRELVHLMEVTGKFKPCVSLHF